MSDEKLQSIAPIEAQECRFEEAAVCEDKPEYHEDTKNQVCSPDVVVNVEYRETEKGIEEIVKLDEKKSLANQARAFVEKPKIKKEEKKEVVVPSKPEEAPAIFKAIELSPWPGGCVEATPATVSAPVLFSVNLDQGALFYLQDFLPNRETPKEGKKKEKAVELANEPIAVACGDSDLARALVREERGNRAAQAVEVLERFFAESHQNISVSSAFPSALDILTEVVFFKPEAVKERKKPEEKEEPQFQTARSVLREDLSSALEISLHGQMIEGHSSSGVAQSPANFLRQFFPADPAVSGLLVFPFALPSMEARGAIAFDGRGIKLALTRVTRGSDAHNSKGSGQQGGKGNSGQDKNRQRSFQ